MIVKIKSIGKAKGICLPAILLEQLSFGNEAEITIHEGALLIKPTGRQDNESKSITNEDEYLKASPCYEEESEWI